MTGYFDEVVPDSRKDVVEDDAVPETTNSPEVIIGVKGLAEYLHVGKTKAQEIIPSGVLVEAGAQYWARGQNFKKDKVDEFLKNNPNGFRGLKYKSIR